MTTRKEIESEITSQRKKLLEEKENFREFQRLENEKSDNAIKDNKIYKIPHFVNSPLHLKIKAIKEKIAELQVQLSKSD